MIREAWESPYGYGQGVWSRRQCPGRLLDSSGQEVLEFALSGPGVL